MTRIEVRGSGGTHQVSVGEELVLDLTEPATAGYAWQLAAEPGPQLELLGSRLEAGEPGTRAPGAAAHRTLRLAARAPGTAHLTLELRRPWEQDPAERLDVEVTVT